MIWNKIGARFLVFLPLAGVFMAKAQDAVR